MPNLDKKVPRADVTHIPNPPPSITKRLRILHPGPRLRRRPRQSHRAGLDAVLEQLLMLVEHRDDLTDVLVRDDVPHVLRRLGGEFDCLVWLGQRLGDQVQHFDFAGQVAQRRGGLGFEELEFFLVFPDRFPGRSINFDTKIRSMLVGFVGSYLTGP
jgi:hypothetical protein